MTMCPCCNDCCADPNTQTFEHECPEIADFCEKCYMYECLNCGNVCNCNV